MSSSSSNSSSSSSVVIKARLNDDLRRFTLTSPFNMNKLIRQLQDSYANQHSFNIKYADDEDDMVTVSNDAELLDAISIAHSSASRILKLTLTIDQNAAPAPTPSISPEQAAVNQSWANVGASIATNPNNALLLGAAYASGDAAAFIETLSSSPANNNTIILDATINENNEIVLESITTPNADVVTILNDNNNIDVGVNEGESSSESESDSSSSSSSSSEDEGVAVHAHVKCDGCGVAPIQGARFKCVECDNYDLCASCESSGVHPSSHGLIKFRVPVVKYSRHPRRHCHRVREDRAAQKAMKQALKASKASEKEERQRMKQEKKSLKYQSKQVENSDSDPDTASSKKQSSLIDRLILKQSKLASKQEIITAKLEAKKAKAEQKQLAAQLKKESKKEGDHENECSAIADLEEQLKSKIKQAKLDQQTIKQQLKDKKLKLKQYKQQEKQPKNKDEPLIVDPTAAAAAASSSSSSSSSVVTAPVVDASQVESVIVEPVVEPAVQPAVIPHKYSNELNELKNMGFYNRELNLYLLEKSNGNLQETANWLLEKSA